MELSYLPATGQQIPKIKVPFYCCVIQSTMSQSVVLNVEFGPSAERAQDSDGRKVNGVEQHILNVDIYKGDASETWTTSSILNKSKAST